MMSRCPLQTEDFYLNSFLSGLRADIQQALYIYKPSSLQDAIDKAKEQEIFIDLMEKRFRGSHKSQSSFSATPRDGTDTTVSKNWQKSTSTPSFGTPLFEDKSSRKWGTNSAYNNSKSPMIRKISPAEMVKRREKGLCYNCDETYVTGHKCVKPQLYLMVGEDDVDEAENRPNPPETNIEENVSISSNDELPGVSIHALNGTQGIHTIKIEGTIGKQAVRILVDTGSTHNFVSTGVLRNQGIPTSYCQPLKVQMANGEATACTKLVSDLKWHMSGTTFQSDFYAIPLGGYDLILGVQWLGQVSPVCFDFGKQEIAIHWVNEQIVLKCDQSTNPEFQVELEERTRDNSKPLACFLVQLTAVEEIKDSTPVPRELQPVIDQFPDIFKTPTGLPPQRPQDHLISNTYNGWECTSQPKSIQVLLFAAAGD